MPGYRVELRVGERVRGVAFALDRTARRELPAIWVQGSVVDVDHLGELAGGRQHEVGADL
jgi:hypothetical protein